MSANRISFSSVRRSVVISLFAIGLVACGRGSPEKLLSSASDYLAKGDRPAAIIELKNLLQKSPDNGEARLMLGQAQLDSREFAAAEKELRRALELRQPQEKVVPLLARALYEQDRFDEVVAELQKYNLFNPPAVASTQTVLGDAYARQGKSERAKSAYAAAVAAVPGYPRARLGQVIATVTDGTLDDALARIDDVIAADPKLAEAHSFKADLLLAKGDRAGAKKALEDAVAADGNLMSARFALISVLISEKAFDGAAAQVAATRKVAPQDLRLSYFDGLIAFRRGDVQKARDLVSQVLKVLPENVPSLVLAGAIELQSSQFASAESHLRRAIAKAPGHLAARRMLVATQLRMGQAMQAKETLQPLLDRSVQADPQLLVLAGETYLANGDVRRASALYQSAAKGEGVQRVAAKTRLGQIALAAGSADQGFRELEDASLLDAGQNQADLALIAEHLRRNELERAMAAVRSLEKKQPSSSLTFQLYGLVHLARRDLAAARKSFERALELQPSYFPAAYALADLDISEGRPNDAIKRYQSMIAKDPTNDQPYLAMADIQARTGAEQKEIGTTLQRVIEANPQSAPARIALVNFYLRNKDAKAALSAAQTANSAVPNHAGIVEMLGVAQENAGEINQAIETYNRLTSLLPQAPQPMLRLASVYARAKETDKAIEALRRVQKLSVSSTDVIPQIARVFMAAGRAEDALKEARALQTREPKFPGGWVLEGDISNFQRNYAGAEKSYREALKLDPKSSALGIRLHSVLAAANKNADADAFAKRWIADNPKDTTMRMYLAERDLNTKSYRSAAAHYQAVVAYEPNNALALNNLAWALGELSDSKALEYAERALKLAPDNAAVLNTFGVLLVKMGDAKKGVDYLARATKLAPNRPDMRLHYAKGLMKLGQKDAARKEFEALLAVKEEFPGKGELPDLLKSL